MAGQEGEGAVEVSLMAGQGGRGRGRVERGVLAVPAV